MWWEPGQGLSGALLRIFIDMAASSDQTQTPTDVCWQTISMKMCSFKASQFYRDAAVIFVTQITSSSCVK